MKKIILFAAPLLLAVVIFVGITFFLNQNSGKGALQVTSMPPASVYLNGKLIGNTPLCIGGEKCASQKMLEIGDYTIKLVPLEGDFKPFEEKISINKSTLTVVDRTFLSGASSSGSIITLTPIPSKKEAQLLIISLPDKANVFLDNNQVGVTPLLLDNITESDHDLTITKSGYNDKSIKIRTTLGYKLITLIFLGINPNISSSPSAVLNNQEQNIINKASGSALITTQKVVILNTPTGFLRVRKESAIASLEIDRVLPGETHELVDEKNGWFKIKLQNGKIGWISSQYAKKE